MGGGVCVGDRGIFTAPTTNARVFEAVPDSTNILQSDVGVSCLIIPRNRQRGGLVKREESLVRGAGVVSDRYG